MLKEIISLFPPHKTYVEPFGGGAHVLISKQPSELEIYNDIDENLVNLFMVLKDPDKFYKLYKLLLLTPYSKEEFEYSKETLNSTQNDIENAYKYFIMSRMSFNGLFKSNWAYARNKSCGGMSSQTSSWLNGTENLPLIHKRLQSVIIENEDFREIFKKYSAEDVLIYADPPYVPDTRVSKSAYKYELTLDDFDDLVRILLETKSKIILSNYRHEFFERLEKHNWKRIDIEKSVHASIGRGNTRNKRIESIWINFDKPKLL